MIPSDKVMPIRNSPSPVEPPLTQGRLREMPWQTLTPAKGCVFFIQELLANAGKKEETLRHHLIGPVIDQFIRGEKSGYPTCFVAACYQLYAVHVPYREFVGELVDPMNTVDREAALEGAMFVPEECGCRNDYSGESQRDGASVGAASVSQCNHCLFAETCRNIFDWMHERLEKNGSFRFVFTDDCTACVRIMASFLRTMYPKWLSTQSATDIQQIATVAMRRLKGKAGRADDESPAERNHRFESWMTVVFVNFALVITWIMFTLDPLSEEAKLPPPDALYRFILAKLVRRAAEEWSTMLVE